MRHKVIKILPVHPTVLSTQYQCDNREMGSNAQQTTHLNKTYHRKIALAKRVN